MPTATITSKGQITIPSEVRKSLNLKAGDKIDFYETEDGNYAFQPKNGSLEDLKGILKKMGHVPLDYAPTVEEMDQDILDYAAELDEATMSHAQTELEDGEAA
jgi:AbrB family looped-hinge helix DNA binding protein